MASNPIRILLGSESFRIAKLRDVTAAEDAIFTIAMADAVLPKSTNTPAYMNQRKKRHGTVFPGVGLLL